MPRTESSRFRCCNCGHVFGEHQALCEDWSDPQRSFICPRCGDYLLRADVVGIQVLQGRAPLRARLARRGPEFAMVLTLLGAVLLVDGMAGELAALGTFFLGGLAVAVVAFQRAEAMPPQETVRAEDLVSAARVDRLH